MQTKEGVVRWWTTRVATIIGGLVIIGVILAGAADFISGWFTSPEVTEETDGCAPVIDAIERQMPAVESWLEESNQNGYVAPEFRVAVLIIDDNPQCFSADDRAWARAFISEHGW